MSASPSSEKRAYEKGASASGWNRGPRGAVTGALALLVVLALMVAAGGVWGRQVLTATGALSDGGRPTIDPEVLRPPPPEPAPPGDPRVLPAAAAGDEVAARALSDRLRAVPRTDLDADLDVVVTDLDTGTTLYREGEGAAIPASTEKLLTGLAVLHELGPEHTFTTSVERRGERWVLVGGGDPLLAGEATRSYPRRAGLDQLADQTAEAAQDAGVTEIDLGLDDSLFSGPAWSPDWPENYRDQVTPVSALVHDQGRTQGVSPGPRVTEPAAATLDRFAELLAERGIDVGDVDTDPAAGPAGTAVAEVRSASVGVLVERMLMTSDNDIAEILFRHAGVAAGEDGSFAGGAAAVGETLDEFGIDDPGRRTSDGSGLSRQNRVEAGTLTAVVEHAAGDDLTLTPLLTGLPVAGAVGSLAGRFADDQSAEGLGRVRAKTGTLRGTHALAGYTRTADGRLVAVALLVNDAENDYAARVWLDRAASAVSSCGC